MMNFLRKQMKWVMAIIVVAFLLSTFFMYEGRSTRRTPGRNPDGTISDYEVAQINGRSLMRSELEQRLRNYLSSYSSRSAESLDLPAIYQEVLNQTILEAQLAKEVQDKGITVSDAEADQAMKSYADMYYPTRETFYQALAQNGITPDDYKRSLARQMATQRLIEEAIGDVVISEDRAMEFYDTMKALIYSKPEGFMVHMADFNTSADAEDFRAKIIAGETWDALASTDLKENINITKEPVFVPTSAFRSGLLSVMASLDIGQPSEVFNVSSFDFAVGVKTSHVDESTSPYDEVSGDIKTLLTQQEQRNRLTNYENELRGKAQVVINDTELFARPAAPEEEPAPAPIVIEEVAEDTEVPETADEATKEEPAQEETAPAAKSEEVTEVVETVEVEAQPEEAPAAVEETVTEVVETEAKPEETPAPAEEEAKPEVTESEPEKAEEPEAKPEDIPAPAEEEAKPESEPEAPVTETPEPVEQVEAEAEVEEAKPTETADVTVAGEEVISPVEDKIEIEAAPTSPEEVTEDVEKIEEKITEAVTELVEEVKEAAE